MNYEDFYDGSQGAFYSLSSMTLTQKIAWISYLIWIGINALAALFLIYKTINKIKKIVYRQRLKSL